MALTVKESARRRNTSPTSTTLHMLVEDIDCSGLPAAPEDGEFIIANANGATAIQTGDVGSDGNAYDLNQTNPPLFRMVWSSALRSDRSALGDTRVPVISKGGGKFKTKLFLCEGTNTPQDSGYVPGAQLTVLMTSHRGTDRGLLSPADATMTGIADDQAVWVVGQVVRVVNNSSVSGTAEIEFLLYSEPRIGYTTA